MNILNFGSLNIDYVYSLDHIVDAGETISSTKLEVFCGGKGLNQSIALAKAGAPVYHAGLIGEDGQMLKNACAEAGVNVKWIKKVRIGSGHAIIQVDKNGQNSIILYQGSNYAFTREYIDEVLADFEEGDMVLLQNEINELDYIIDRAYDKKMRIILNPSPYNEKIDKCNLEKVGMFIVNEVEAEQILNEYQVEGMTKLLAKKFPKAEILLTLGEKGAEYRYQDKTARQHIFPVEAVDTTAAGDTFTGYYLAGRIEGLTVEEALERAAMASSIAVSRKGASPSIPYRKEVVEALDRITEHSVL